MRDRLRILVLGYIVRGPLGGLVWHHLQYVKGFVDLGHEVYFVEDSDDYASCYDPVRNTISTDPSYGLEFAVKTFEYMGLGRHWAYYDAHSSRWMGPCAADILRLCATADLLVHMSGKNRVRAYLSEVPVRVLVDTDPVFTQLRHLKNARAKEDALKHTAFFSFGENIANGRSSVPSDGYTWHATRQPIVLDAWPVTQGPEGGKFTTVMQWDSYATEIYEGTHYGMKSDSFGPYLDLPLRMENLFELAVGSPTAPRALLASNGWMVRNPLEVTRTAWSYQRYIQASKAEFGIAKHGYVVSWSGWFSERSAAYLASGRPVLLQDTGFSEWLETGAGVLKFQNRDELMAGIEDINRRYRYHCHAARAIAETYFDARKVLSRLINHALNPNRHTPARSDETNSN